MNKYPTITPLKTPEEGKCTVCEGKKPLVFIDKELITGEGVSGKLCKECLIFARISDDALNISANAILAKEKVGGYCRPQ